MKSRFSNRVIKCYLPAFAILALSMSVTVLLWHYTKADVLRNAQAEFDFRVEEIKQEIAHRMRGYEQVLRGGVGLFDGSEDVNREEWRSYVKSLKIEQSYPGIQGIGFAKIIPPSELKKHIIKQRSEGLAGYSVWPEGERGLYTSIIYLEPLDWRNQRAIGYDMYSEPVRRAAMDKAVEMNMTAISGKVKLVQETEKDIQAGFLMYLPVYRKGMDISTPAQRRDALLGYVYSPFRMNDLMAGIIGRKVPDIDLHLYDGHETKEKSRMYDSDHGDHSTRADAAFSKVVRMEINGNVWTLEFSAIQGFDVRMDREKPMIVLAAGAVISLLFFAIGFFLASNRARLHEMNRDLNDEVAERKKAEEELRIARDRLEVRVRERTRELTAANESLQKEVLTRRQAEAALRQSQERFRSLVETTNDWVWEIGRDLSYTYAGPMVQEILGYSPEEMSGRTPFDLMEKEEADRFSAALAGFAESKSPFTLEIKKLRRDGSEAIIETSAAPIISPAGGFLGYRGIDRDVTERIRIEKEREKMREQLLHSQKMELMGRLAAGVAHDFNNVMTIITSLNSLARKEAKVDPVRDCLDQIQAATERAMNLTRQLLIFSRSQPTRTVIVDINRTVEDMVKLLRHILGENISVASELDKELFPVQADKSNIEQLLMNLVINSKDAMPEGGGIFIKTDNTVVNEGGNTHARLSPGNYVCISVRDSGSGMDEEVLKQVFEPFFSTKEPGKGIGLGLTVVNNIVKEYNGGISIESRPGEGTVFRVYLPACSGAKAGPVLVDRVEEPQGRGETVLILEDEVMLSRSVALVLSKSGYRVFTAQDSSSAERIFNKNDIHLVFSDVVLKGKSGINIVDELIAAKPGLKAIFASGYMNVESQWPYIKEKGFGFLQKPYEIPELLRAIRKCLDEA